MKLHIAQLLLLTHWAVHTLGPWASAEIPIKLHINFRWWWLRAIAWKQSMAWFLIDCNQSLQPKQLSQMKCNVWSFPKFNVFDFIAIFSSQFYLSGINELLDENWAKNCAKWKKFNFKLCRTLQSKFAAKTTVANEMQCLKITQRPELRFSIFDFIAIFSSQFYLSGINELLDENWAKNCAKWKKFNFKVEVQTV